MSIDPPPSRYRVIERNGRLEVTDTWAGRNPAPPPPAAAPVAHFADLVIEEPAPKFAPMPDFPRLPPDVPPPPTYQPARDGMPAKPPELLRLVAGTVGGGARDAEGRLILTTAGFYDRKAPREIALDADGERELGLATLIILIIAVSGIVLAVSIGWPGIIAIAIALSFARNAKAVATPWLDRLEARSA